MIRGLLFLCALVALVAFSTAFALDSKTQGMGWKRRAKVSALVGGVLPMLVLALAFALSGDPRANSVSVYVVLAGFWLILSAVIAYPTAYLFTRSCNRSRQAETFE